MKLQPLFARVHQRISPAEHRAGQLLTPLDAWMSVSNFRGVTLQASTFYEFYENEGTSNCDGNRCFCYTHMAIAALCVFASASAMMFGRQVRSVYDRKRSLLLKSTSTKQRSL